MQIRSADRGAPSLDELVALPRPSGRPIEVLYRLVGGELGECPRRRPTPRAGPSRLRRGRRPPTSSGGSSCTTWWTSSQTGTIGHRDQNSDVSRLKVRAETPISDCVLLGSSHSRSRASSLALASARTVNVTPHDMHCHLFRSDEVLPCPPSPFPADRARCPCHSPRASHQIRMGSRLSDLRCQGFLGYTFWPTWVHPGRRIAGGFPGVHQARCVLLGYIF